MGGLLGLFFQRRAWAHQHQVERRELERQDAMKVFEEVSTLLDRRLYRMRRLWWAAKQRAGGGGLERLAAARDDYDEVLMVWNDNLHRHGALIEVNFGGGARKQMESEVYEEFAAIGRALDRFVRGVSAGPGVEVPPLGRRLDALSYRVYRFNVRLLRLLQEARVGSSAPPPAAEQVGVSTVQFGHQGPAVTRLQRALRRAGHPRVRVDGHFGEDTENALRAFQGDHGLDVDGVAGPRTWDALPPTGPMPSLREGAQGEVVAKTQAALTAAP